MRYQFSVENTNRPTDKEHEAQQENGSFSIAKGGKPLSIRWKGMSWKCASS
jgi:hypothetical protein